MTTTFEADNGEPITAEEHQAIQSLERLAKRWPQTLTLLSYDGGLSVVHSADVPAIAEGNGVERENLVLAAINGIPERRRWLVTPIQPADELRAAAKQMRRFAQAAQGDLTRIQSGRQEVVEVTTMAAASLAAAGFPGAEHVALWRPVLALAVADLLEREAALIDAQVFPQSDPVMEKYPLAVARAYLDQPIEALAEVAKTFTEQEATP